MKIKEMDKYKVLETMATLALALIVFQFVFAENLKINTNVNDYLFLWLAASFLAIALFSTALVGLAFILINLFLKNDLANWYCVFIGIALLFSSALPFKLSELIAYYWLKLGEGIGFVMSKVILGSVFFIFVSPLSFLFRLFNRKHMQLNKCGDSYYIVRNKIFEKKDLRNSW